MCSQLGILQLACAALEALDHKGNYHRDKMYATEKVRNVIIVYVCINGVRLQILVNSIGGNGSSPIKQLTELMSQKQSGTDDYLEYVYVHCIGICVHRVKLFTFRTKMNMADVICLAIHLYSLVGKQCASGISEDMRFQVFI